MESSTPIVHETPVLVVGSGPVGLVTSLQLARYGQKCILVERNYETTKWPKMDITNCRSMELLRNLGLADALRKIGVDEKYSFNVLFSSGLNEGGKRLARWDLPSPAEWKKRIQEQNDGSMPREPYQRCSQSVFERWLKPICEENPLIESYFGWKFESLEETPEKVISRITALSTGQTHIVHSKFVVACDGAGSRVRRSIGLDLIGGPTPSAVFLVHFKSRDLTRLQAQGQFWHIFFTTGAAIISQDEIDTWTCHYPVSLDQDTTKLDPTEVIYAVLGGSTGRYPIQVDKILVTSVFRPNLVVANEYISPHQRVFLAGDSAHQNIPTGGYGMNMGVGDAYDIGWKLGAYLKGYAGETLLRSYGVERRPVALRNVERSGVHMSLHFKYAQMVNQKGSQVLLAQDAEGETLREEIKQMILAQDGENKDHGIEMGYRLNDSPVINHDENGIEPLWTPREYTPSTWPGSRAPHVFLKDSVTSITDLYGLHYTIVDFTTGGETAKNFSDNAEELGIPLKAVHLRDEPQVRRIWERDVVLVRPDGHVAWRSSSQDTNTATKESIKHILLVAVGKETGPTSTTMSKASTSSASARFTTSVENVLQDTTQIAQIGEFQR